MKKDTPIKIKKWASYKGYRVWLSTRDAGHYNASFACDGYFFPGPTDWMIGMRNVGQGEYWGRIPVDDPELKIEEHKIAVSNHGLESTGAPPAAESPETHP